MPLKDLTARYAYAKAKYLSRSEESRLAQNERSKLRRREIAEVKRSAKLLEPVVQKTYICSKCAVDITQTYIPKHGCLCSTCYNAYQKAYREANKARIAESKRLWKIANAGYVAAKDKAYADAHPERRVKARAKWDKANPGMLNACKARSKCARKKRVPTWLSEDDAWMISQAYDLAAVRTKLFGFPWHVDHIIPLQGRLVSGLHVPCNLRVIPGAENVRKNNRYEVV